MSDHQAENDYTCVVCSATNPRHGGLCCEHRYDEQPPCIEERREAAVQAMIAKGYTRERAEHVLFEIVGKTLFGAGGALTSSPGVTE